MATCKGQSSSASGEGVPKIFSALPPGMRAQSLRQTLGVSLPYPTIPSDTADTKRGAQPGSSSSASAASASHPPPPPPPPHPSYSQYNDLTMFILAQQQQQPDEPPKKRQRPAMEGAGEGEGAEGKERPAGIERKDEGSPFSMLQQASMEMLASLGYAGGPWASLVGMDKGAAAAAYQQLLLLAQEDPDAAALQLSHGRATGADMSMPPKERPASTERRKYFTGAFSPSQGVSWDRDRKVWVAQWKATDGSRQKRAFDPRQYGFDGAKQKALAARMRAEADGQVSVPQKAEFTCDRRGVHYDKDKGCWTATWFEKGKRRSKRFSCRKLGHDEAKKQAMEHRTAMEQQHYTFHNESDNTSTDTNAPAPAPAPALSLQAYQYQEQQIQRQQGPQQQ
mmetsp:Transcript_34329/g.85053  ORF Transcript_34329/g.85053 Transcript_34329/m.85053 type:complete len:394 (+) Transcript_34329:186-1367(+)